MIRLIVFLSFGIIQIMRDTHGLRKSVTSIWFADLKSDFKIKVMFERKRLVFKRDFLSNSIHNP